MAWYVNSCTNGAMTSIERSVTSSVARARPGSCFCTRASVTSVTRVSRARRTHGKVGVRALVLVERGLDREREHAREEVVVGGLVRARVGAAREVGAPAAGGVGRGRGGAGGGVRGEGAEGGWCEGR